MTLLNESDFHRIFHGSTVAEETECQSEDCKPIDDSEQERMDAIRREGL